MNGKHRINKPRMPKPKIVRCEGNKTAELKVAMKTLKNEKAAGIDDMYSE